MGLCALFTGAAITLPSLSTGSYGSIVLPHAFLRAGVGGGDTDQH